MSIAGIAKEVATISVSALVFGDELTPLNITGVAVTVCGEFAHSLYWCRFDAAPYLSPIFSKKKKRTTFLRIGIGLFTHHKYRKRLESDIPLDPHGKPFDPEDDGGLGPGSIALRDGYGITVARHGDGGTAAVRLWYHSPVPHDGYSDTLAMQLEPLLLVGEGTQDENSVIFDSDVDASVSDDDSDAASGSLDP